MPNYSQPNPAKILFLFAEIQNHLHNGVIEHELNKILKHTSDQEIIRNCQSVARCLDIKIERNFVSENSELLCNCVKRLTTHLKWAKEKFDKIVELAPDCDPKWIESPLKATELQLLSLSNYFVLLDKVPDSTDSTGQTIKSGDLVAIRCKDESDRSYEHYGVVISTSKGFRVAHFFTGHTVKGQNTLVEKGFGYIHEVNYTPEWVVKQHLPLTVPYNQVEQRIKESRKQERRIWNKLTYNCEHWAREMVEGEPNCTQLKNWRQEIRSKQSK